jgi:hypothetical protein
MVRVCLAGVAVAMGALLAVTVGNGAQSASRIVDRTLECRMAGTGYPDPVRYADVSAAPRLGDAAPSAHVFNGPPPMGFGYETAPSFGSRTGGLFLGLERCRATGIRISLSARGLRGGETALGERHKCDVPARVLIRVRAVFKRPVTLRRVRGTLSVNGEIATASLAVAALRGRNPIVYAASDDGSGKTRIFVSRSACVPNQ